VAFGDIASNYTEFDWGQVCAIRRRLGPVRIDLGHNINALAGREGDAGLYYSGAVVLKLRGPQPPFSRPWVPEACSTAG